MKSTALSGLAAAAFSALAATTALAADLPTKKQAPIPYVAPFSWTGFYLGGNVGVIWETGNIDVTGSPGYFDLGTVYPGLIANSFSRNGQTDLIGGIQAGYNYQFGSLVLGIESDFDGTSVNSSSSFIGSNTHFGTATVTSSYETRMDWLGTTRLRLGWTPVDKALIYATGGVAYGHGSTTNGVQISSSSYLWNGSTDYTHVGWTAGGGAELAVTNNVLIRAEALYYDLGSENVSALGNTNVLNHPAFDGVYLSTKENLTGVIGRIGVDYKF
jgi:outer membrane immunogenic protein